MTTLRDVPMITVEQKNRFREAALKVEAERDALAAWLDECLSAMRHASEFLDEFDKDAALALHRMNSLSSRSRGPDASLTGRDARMKAEALESAASIYHVRGLVEADSVLQRLTYHAEYHRKQAEGES